MSRLPYASFFDEVDALSRSGREWRELACGLVVLRHADAAWHGCRPLAGETRRLCDWWSVAGQDAFTAREVFALMRATATASQARIVRAKWKYARRLEFLGANRCSSDVYESILGQLRTDETRRRTTCLIRLGYCRKWSADFDGARRAFRYALESAQSCRDVAGTLRARFALADLAAVIGNFGVARRGFRRLRHAARRAGARALYARVLHAESNLAYFREEYDRSVRLGYRALRLTTGPESRNRIWADIANALVQVGARSMARDICERLQRTTQQRMLRWAVTFCLMEISAAEGDAGTVDSYAQWLLDTRMSSHQQAYLYSALGEAYDRLQFPDKSREYLRRAMVIASEHGIKQLVRHTKGLLGQAPTEPAMIRPEWLESISAELATSNAIRSE